MERVSQVVFLSATPGPYELEHVDAGGRADRAPHRPGRSRGHRASPPRARSTTSSSRSTSRVAQGDRVLVTTLTKKMAEDLTDYLLELGVRVRYLHTEVDTIQRIEILRDLRLGEFDVLVGINLLREGLDLPEVSLVAILDADKEGFLRSETSLIQTIGRAARNVDGQVIMYADTGHRLDAAGHLARPTAAASCSSAYNDEHGIDPQTIRKAVTDILAYLRPAETAPDARARTSRSAPRATERRARPGRAARRRAGPAHPHPRGGDARGRGRPPLRVRRPPARRDQGPQARAPRRRGLDPARRRPRPVRPCRGGPAQGPGAVRLLGGKNVPSPWPAQTTVSPVACTVTETSRWPSPLISAAEGSPRGPRGSGRPACRRRAPRRPRVSAGRSSRRAP